MQSGVNALPYGASPVKRSFGESYRMNKIMATAMFLRGTYNTRSRADLVPS